MSENTRNLLTIVAVSGLVLALVGLRFIWQIYYEHRYDASKLHYRIKKLLWSYDNRVCSLFQKPTRYERMINQAVDSFCRCFNKYQLDYLRENLDYTYSFIDYKIIETYLETHLDQDNYSEIKILTFKIERKRIKDNSAIEHMYKKLVRLVHKTIFDYMINSGRLKTVQFLTPLFPKYKGEIVEFEIFYVYNRNIYKLINDFSWR